MTRHRLRVWVLATLVIAFTAVSAIVFAEWLATGSGRGNAIAGESLELRVEPTSNLGNWSDTMRLLPGDNGDLQVVIYNENLFDVEVREISQNGPITSDAQGCDGTTGEVTYTTQTGLWVVPAQDRLAVKLVDALAMGVDAANECQGAEFAVPVTVTGGSAVGSTPTTTTTTTLPGSGGLTTFYLDNDGDQFGLDSNTVEAETQPSGYATVGGDCDDNDQDMYPGNQEIADGKDNDCNGLIDDTPTTTTPPPVPVETCDGVDNDGNGLIDDGLSYCFGGAAAPNTDGGNSCDPGWYEVNGVLVDGCESQDPAP